MPIDIRVLFTLELMLRRRGYDTQILTQLLGQYDDSELSSERLEQYFQWILSHYNNDPTARAQSDAYSMSQVGQGIFITHRAEFKDAADQLNLAYSFRVARGNELMHVIFGDREIGWAYFVSKIILDGRQLMDSGLPYIMRYIFIYDGKMNNLTEKAIMTSVRENMEEDPTRFQSFAMDELMIDPLDCAITPPHVPMTDEETEAKLKASGLSRSQIPPIYTSDAIIKHLGCSVGTGIRLFRTANIPGHIVDASRFYRIVTTH